MSEYTGRSRVAVCLWFEREQLAGTRYPGLSFSSSGWWCALSPSSSWRGSCTGRAAASGTCGSGTSSSTSALTDRPVGAEELAQFGRVELGFLERREVPAARHLGHPGDVRRALQP